MRHSASIWPASNGTTDRTLRAIEQQISGMGSLLFEIGLYKIDATAPEPPMIPRIWNANAIITSARWLRHQNREGRNI